MIGRRKILIIRFSSIGDIILTTPVIRCVKQQSGDEIHFLTYRKFADILVPNPYIDRIIAVDRLNVDLIISLRRENYYLIIDLHKNLKSLLIKNSLLTKSINFNKLNLQKWVLVNFAINLMPEKHLIDRYFEALKSIGIVDDGQGMDYFYEIHTDRKSEFLSLLPERYLCLVLGATYFTKRIPVTKCSEIIDGSHLPIVLLGGNDVGEEAVSLQALYPDVINLVGKLNLHESAFCIDKSYGVITGDTGLMHMAAALKKPIAMVWGGTSPEIGMYPYYGKNNQNLSVHFRVNGLNCQPCSKIGKNRCPKGHFDCMMKQDFTSLESEFI
mgnify:CR=1 FL=1